MAGWPSEQDTEMKNDFVIFLSQTKNWQRMSD
jgi:hypothetical protein